MQVLQIEHMKNFLLSISILMGSLGLHAQAQDTIRIFDTPVALRCGADTVVLDAGEEFVSYFWSTGEDTRTIKVTESGLYDVTASESGGQIQEAECELTIARILQEPDSLCYKDTIFLVVNENDLRYSWNTGNPEDTLYFLQASLTASKTYTVAVTDEDRSCIDSLRMDMYPRIYVEFEQNQENKGCPGGDCK